MKPARAEAQHSSANGSWGTPRPIVEVARKVLGRIDFDPFSDAGWNASIGATRYLTAEDDAFARAWFDGSPTAHEIVHIAEPYWTADWRPRAPSTALINAPGDKRGLFAKQAWRLVEWHHRTGWLGDGALWVAFNIGQLQTLQGVAPRSPLHGDFLRCIPRRRIRYESAPGVVGDCPPHASALVLLPAHGALGDLQRSMFVGLTAEIGEVF